jgi:hypothetical protein
VACRKLQAHVDQPQPPVEGLTGLRYRESQRTHVGVREPAPTPATGWLTISRV